MSQRRYPCGPQLLLLCTLIIAAPLSAQERPGSSPHQDGSASSSRFGANAGVMAVRWRAELGSGYSGVAVAAGRAVTMFTDGPRDVLAAFDTETGKETWRLTIAERHVGIDGSFDGPISTPVIANGSVFALGPLGHLMAVDLADGRVLWRTDLRELVQATRPHYGFASSPLVAGGVLVVQVGTGNGQAIAGFDLATGARRWTAGKDTVEYQSPVLLRLGSREIVVAAGSTRLTGLDPATGRVLFDHPHGGVAGEISIFSAVPVPAGDGRVFLKTHPDGATMFRLTEQTDGKITVDALWTAPVMRQTYVVPVYYDGHLYGMNGRTVLTCVDAATGDVKWRSREPGDGFPTLVGDRIVFVTKTHTLHVGPASPLRWSEHGRLQLFDDLVWTAPTVVGNSVFARSLGEMARVDWTAAVTTTVDPARPTVASPTFARFLEELDRADDKGAAVDRFLASVKDGPLVDAPDRVVFLYRGDAQDVGIATDLIGVRREDRLQRVPGTDLFFYEAQVGPAARISYQFVRDFGTPMLDPRNPRRVPAMGPGTEASSLAMPGWREPTHLAESPAGRRGRVETVEFASTLRPGARQTLHVYVPFGYNETTDRYPAAYVLDGDMARAQGLVPRSLDHLMPSRVAPALVVFHGSMEWGAAKPAASDAMALEIEILVKEIVPLIDARFRTLAAPSGRAIVGHLWLGIVATHLAFHDSGLFGALGLQSLFMLDTDRFAIEPQVRTATARPLRVYHDWGFYGHASTREAADLRETNRRFYAFLRAKGFEPAGGEVQDGLGWASWRNRTDLLFAALFPPR
ncbi:MAG: PQQ-binding-like beta-propeller repeat protein [Vicinamibacterales bacterium]